MNQVVRAEDSGGKFSTAAVNVEVTDVNDSPPTFLGEPYSFRVREGVAGEPVGNLLYGVYLVPYLEKHRRGYTYVSFS